MELLDWIDERLAAVGRKRTGEPTVFRARPWAEIRCVPTDRGPVWLKLPSARTGFEVGLYAVLAEVVPDRVLVPLGADAGRRRLLLPDGGPPLSGPLDAALSAYGELQRRMAPHVERMLGLGVPDMRPVVMSQRFEEALAAIGAEGGPGGLRERFTAGCEALAAAPGGTSVDHNDLHAGNVLAGERFYDWGDAVVAHPFASMLVPLARTGDGGTRLRDAYLEAYSDLASHAELVATLELACWVGKVARALTWLRAVGPGHPAPRRALAAVLEPDYLAGF